MKTIKFFSAALFVLAASACNPDYTTENFSNLEPMTIAGIQTKTSLNDDGSVNWTAGDQIAIYDDLDGEQHIFTNTSDKVSYFTGMVTARTEQFWGVYPTNLITSFNNGTVTMTLPSDQTPVAGTFAEELNISVTSGAKTPGTELVEGISFHNACGLIAFTVPANIAAQKVTFISDNSFISGTMTVNCATSEAVLESNQSNSVSMTGKFAAGSTFYFVVAPGQIDGFSINVETEKGSYYSKSASKGKINVTPGSLTRLGQISFKAGAVTASAEHVYESGVLTGSSLTVNHGIPQNMWNDVTSLSVSVVKKGETYSRRKCSYSKIEDASVVPLGDTYLPQGWYDINVEYTMHGVPTTITGEVEVPQPDQNKFKLKITSVEATTSYSLAKKGSSYVDQANSHDPEKITSPKCTFAGISTAVLNELKPTCSFSVSGKTNQGTVSGTSGSCGEFSGLSWGSHTLTATVTFDGVSSSATTSCHITGLPYKNVNFYGEGLDYIKELKWTYKNVAYANSKCRIQADGSNGYLISPGFNIPSDIKTISYKIGAQYYRSWLINVSSKSIELRVGVTNQSSTVASTYNKHSCAGSNNTGNSYTIHSGTLSSLNPTSYISIHHNNANISAQIDELSISSVEFLY